MITVNWWFGAPVAGLGAILTGAICFWLGRRYPPRGLLDAEYDRGADDEARRAHSTIDRLRRELVWWERHSGHDWRQAQREQLSPERLDETAAIELPGPAPTTVPAVQNRAGELHHQPGRIRLVDMGDTGDTAMLDRDWFDRRAWLKSLRYPAGHPLEEFGGFDLTETGHVVAVA